MPPSRIDVHIGVPKTGATTVQAALGRGRERLAAAGIVVPRSFHHRGLAVVALDRDRDELVHQVLGLHGPADVDDYRERAAEGLAREAATGDRVVLATEHLAHWCTQPDELERLRRWLARTGCEDIRVLVYLRRQDRRRESHYSTRLRAGADEDLTWPPPVPMAYEDYDALLTLWAGVFGADRVQPRRYGREHLVGGDVVTDLEVALGLPTLPRANRNTGYDARVQQYLRLVNRHLPWWEGRQRNPAHAALVAALDRLPATGHPLQLSLEDARACLDDVREGNRRVARRWFGQAELFDETLAPRRPVEPLTAEDAAAITAAVLPHLG